MLPLLNAAGGVAGASAVARAPAPRRFVSAGRVDFASFINLTSVAEGNTASRKAGLRYESRALDALCEEFGNDLLPSPWINFASRGRFRRCQPDALLFTPGRCCIIEIKLSHTADAWWQLRKLYEPVVRRLFPLRRIDVVEITRHIDPFVNFPEDISLLQYMRDLRNPISNVGCLSWRS